MMGKWSFAEDRRFVEIAAAAKSFDEVVQRIGRNPASVRKLGKQIVSDNRLTAGMKAKGK